MNNDIRATFKKWEKIEETSNNIIDNFNTANQYEIIINILDTILYEYRIKAIDAYKNDQYHEYKQYNNMYFKLLEIYDKLKEGI